MATVLPSGSPASAGDLAASRGASGDDDPTRDDEPVGPEGTAVPVADDDPARDVDPPAARPGWRPGEVVARLPAVLRVPLQVLGRTVAKAWHDRILGLSAEASFWQVLSVPPLLIGLLGSLGYLGSFIGQDSVTEIEARLVQLASEGLTDTVVQTLVQPTLTDILGSGRLDVVSVGFVLSLWAGSSATATFMNTTVIAYDQRDVRGPIRTRLMALGLFVVALVVAVLSLPLLVLGRTSLVALLPTDFQGTATVLVNAVYWPLVLVVLVLALTSFYHVTLPRRLPWLRHLLGAAFAAGFFISAALVLRTYVADVLTTALPYGALAAPIAALLFCFFLGMAILLGAELNATVEARWPAGQRRHDRRRRRRRAAKIELEARKLGLR
ncbi:membrane protein [Klenkia soli]|uniref:Membrane protein n=1 Tax=Klenkia soli TaxID=1052260 RepID=A0A1H0TQR3_9ACTN|nr:YihY/virulence factor BrkB family protein [Klenkia soli]SDP56263.1 membrane protein [Klenkia soli]